MALLAPTVSVADGPQEATLGGTTGAQDPNASVTLVSFAALAGTNAIRLTWKTASEVDNLGFHLYRAESVNGPWIRLNERLIPSQVTGKPTGATYEFVDTAVYAGTTYYYWLEHVEISNARRLYGPVDARLLFLFGGGTR